MLEVTSVTKIGNFLNCKALISRGYVFSVFYGVLNKNTPFISIFKMTTMKVIKLHMLRQKWTKKKMINDYFSQS